MNHPILLKSSSWQAHLQRSSHTTLTHDEHFNLIVYLNKKNISNFDSDHYQYKFPDGILNFKNLKSMVWCHTWEYQEEFIDKLVDKIALISNLTIFIGINNINKFNF